MELMSPLLLCALAALLPQALGVKSSFISEVKRESPKVIDIPFIPKTVWLQNKRRSEVTLDTVLEYLSHSKKCSFCLYCVHQAIYFLGGIKTTEGPIKHMQSRDFILNDIIENYHQYKMVRDRRDTENRILTKTKRSQVSKSKNVTVTKYNIDGQVYAIKLREKNMTDAGTQQGEKSCQVYGVKKYYPCDSPKAELIFTNAKRKANKRSKKQEKIIPTTSKPQSQTVASRDKPLAEPFMTSIEELYN